MSAYSIGGYGLAVGLRSSKTILVEGVTDKRVLTRMLLDRQLRTRTSIACVVDEVELISDPALAGIGSKQRVEIVAGKLAHLSDKLNWLVDREWEGLDIDNPPQRFSMLPAGKWGKRTKGHSIENYWLWEPLLSAYLQMFLGDELGADYFLTLAQRFDAMLRLAAAYSFTLKRLSLLSRCIGAIRASDINWTGSQYIVLTGLNTTLCQRNVTVDVVAEVNAELAKQSVQATSPTVLQWMSHGHLGEEVVRSCAANLAVANGRPQLVVERIERGARAEKLAHDATFLGSLDEDRVEPLCHLVTWAQ